MTRWYEWVIVNLAATIALIIGVIGAAGVLGAPGEI